MKRKQGLLALGMILVLFFSLTVFTSATEETEAVATGFVDVKVFVPPDFADVVLIDLDHENGKQYEIRVEEADGYKVKKEVESGSYHAYARTVSGEDNACSTCNEQGLTTRYPATLVVVEGGNTFFEVEIIYPEKDELNEGLAEETEEPVVKQEETVASADKQKDKDTEEEKIKEEKRITQRVLEYVEGDNPDVFEQRESFGKRILKKNFLTLIMLFLLCMISIYVEFKRRLRG
ncbi:MAG: hypothetical protein PHV56_08150 [Clostridia bacterium]|nr:hypothetical protein [Clostridia bacterium]